GSPQEVEYRPSFVDGAGGRRVLPGMWPVVSPLVDGALTASLDETAAAVRLLVERVRLIAEGAGALALAAAHGGRAGSGQVGWSSACSALHRVARPSATSATCKKCSTSRPAAARSSSEAPGIRSSPVPGRTSYRATATQSRTRGPTNSSSSRSQRHRRKRGRSP